MSIKTNIKNDLWRVNYVLPFVKKHQFDEKGKADMLRRVIRGYRCIHPVQASRNSSVGADTKALLSRVDITIRDDSRFVYFLDTHRTLAVPGNILSNFTLDYDRAIHGTFEEMAARASGDDDYGRETALAADGIRLFAARIADALRLSGHPRREKLAGYFDRMLTEKAAHFDEALQRILFFNQILWQTRHRLNGLGRLDRILIDLYEADCGAGLLTEEKAEKIVLDFLAQLSRYAHYKSDALEGDIGQIIILGGLNVGGSYFCNVLTEIFLRAQARLAKPDPKTFLRVSGKMPPALLRTAVSCLSAKTGSPLFSNDDVVIPALIAAGIEPEDAYSYCVSACWEPFITGKSMDQNNIAVFDYFEALDEVLGHSHKSFDGLVEDYIAANGRNFRRFLQSLDELRWAKDPLVSLFTDGCTEKRRDISGGSCRYRNYGITTVGLPNTIDSLMNIRKLCFENADGAKYTEEELNLARTRNFREQDALYNELAAMPKSFGHDDGEVIALVNRITASAAELAKAHVNPLGGNVKIGLSSPGYNILSKKTAADLAGRKAGMPYSTHISCMDAPYTEVANFAGKLDYTQNRHNGNVVDFFVSPDLVSRNADKFALFLRGAVQAGFFQMQMNVLDSRTLADAKAHPENYRGLIVRVWGFSAYFNELPESYKDLMIARAQAAEALA